MNKLILPINAYIVNSNGSIVDAFSGTPSYGNENGADVYHVYNADNNAYYNVLMTEELKAVIANTFNTPYAGGSYTGGGTRVLTVSSENPKIFEWEPINSLVASPRIQGIYLNDKYLTPGQHGYSSANGHSQSVLVYAKEPNFLYVTAPSGSAAYIALKSEGKGNGSVYYTEDPYSNNWNLLNYDTSLNVAGKKYYLSGNVNPYVGTNTDNYIHFATSGANTISFYGDITYLVGNTGPSNYNEPAYTGGDKVLKNYQFCKLFYNCAQIIKAPDLPSMTLSTCCYIGMFNHCTSLTKAPELPATTLAASCYYEMFAYCTNLTKAPELPATTLATSCYRSMFYYCSSLTKAPELPATTLATSCYYEMFEYCRSLVDAPNLPATTLTGSCYYQMFYSCTSLTKAPELPATTLSPQCYGDMFYNCTKLNYVKALFTTTPTSAYTNNWLYNVASTGTFVKYKNATWTNVGTYAVPTGWTAYTTEQLHTDELPESYIEDTGKVLMVDASGLWVKKELNVDSMTNVTYSDIKTLRDTSALTPGMLYRITDYECTTSVADTSVAGHAFDIVVVADSSDTLNENARAIQNADDNYFDNANLQAWDLKYTIDNDDVYAWATPDGKGVVYYMEDEYGNVCGYDFKNIKFAFADTSSALVDSSDHYYYTFTDASTDGDLSMKKDSSTVCEKNRIMALNDDVSFILPFTVFIAGNSVYNNTILDASGNIFCEAHDNEIDRAIGNVADGAFNFNEVGSMLNNWFTGASEANSMKYISDSKFGGNFAFNTIRYCANVTAGSSFMLNEVGEYFCNSSFGNNCYDNFFGPYCGNITAGNDFRQNTLELQCNNLTFGNNCTFNRMGTVSYSRIGNNCYSNQIDGGKYIIFGNASNQGGDWIAGNRLIGLTQYVYFYNTNNAGQSNTLRKYHLFNICGTSGSYKHVSDVTRNNSGEIFVLTRPGYTTPDANSLIYVNPAVLPEKTKGGTAGQILVKISGTDYDMGWRTVDVGSQIAYDSSNKTISLKDVSGNVLGTPIDATDFIKDGMVSDVSVYDSNLVISFNTDAGKEDISIPLSHIFDSSNYYTKSEINDMFEETELSTAMALNDLNARVEDASSKISVFAESIDDMRLDITDLSTSISYIDSSIAIIDASISALDTSVSALDASVKRIDASVKIIDASVKRIDASVKRIDTSVRDMSTYIADISTRVDDNELIVASALSDLDSRIEDVSSRIGGGGTATDLMTSVTYAELRTLRDSSLLVPGMQYYIYDYVTTVGDASLSSAMHPFGIIVTANSSSELDESARMCKAENDEYYTNLDAYEIKYCIDNDSSRFGWVDPNGKGVIYYMKDDNRNEACYDFTNILFDSKYTFDYNGTDARLNASANIHDNVIGPHYGGYASAGSQQTYYTLSPNNIVFEGLMNYNNTFGNDCYDLKFANQTMFNTFDGAVWDCSFGAMTLYNHFGSYITGSVFPAKLATSDIGSNTLYINISGTTTYIRCRIMPNTRGTSTSSRLSISITETGQHAGLNSSGVLKKWLPADLID